MNQNKPGQPGKRNVILNIVLVLCVIVILFCAVKIVQSLIEYKRAEDKYSQIGSQFEDLMTGVSSTVSTTTAVTTTVPTTEATIADTSATEETEPVVTEPVPQPKEEYRALYEHLRNTKDQYPDLFGWIYIAFDADHVINLPVMKGQDNNFYINHAYDGTAAKAGAIFADYRNTDRRLDLNQNIVLYGHNMNDSSMFAMVSSKYKNRTNFETVPITFYTLDGVYLFNVFSIYNGKAGADYDTIAFSGDKLQQFCYAKQMSSFYKKNLTFDTDETVITLVTCTNYSDDGRVIVHGVLDGYVSFFD